MALITAKCGNLTDIEEIAILMEIKPSNVKNKIYRTLKEMRRLYQKEEVSL